ncbi:MAG: thioredoxin domain-containing protein [Planctomycetes bacterium]|nr:thioredoxin domain-containing protein [Planctomycetota bacterium]
MFAQTARGICDYVLRDLQSPQGGFYSTRDADSEGMEGKYYIWTVEQVTEVLGTDDAELFCSYYDVTETGNWVETRGHAPKGPKNILNIQKDDDAFAKLHKLDVADWKRRLGAMKSRMLEARDRRVAPGLDDKILTGWNGLMIATLAKASQVLDQPRYAEAASKATDFILTNLRRDGKLLRSYRAGKARLTGYLSDYAFFTEGLLNLYESTFEVRHLDEAVQLTDDLIKRYYDEAKGAFFYTASDAEKLVARTKNVTDGAIPAANSVAATNLMRLAILTGNREYRAKAESIFQAFATLVARSPLQFERMLCAVDFYYGPPKEIAIIPGASAEETEALLSAIYGSFLPNKVVASVGDAAPLEAAAQRIPLLRGKHQLDDKATAYVCENYSCKEPVTDALELKRQLGTRE